METDAVSKEITEEGTSVESESDELRNVMTLEQRYEIDPGNVLLVQEQMVLGLENMAIKSENPTKLIERRNTIEHGVTSMGLENILTEPTNIPSDAENIVTETDAIIRRADTIVMETEAQESIFSDRRNSTTETDNIMMEIEKIITDPENIIMDAMTDSENLLITKNIILEAEKIMNQSDATSKDDIPAQEKTTTSAQNVTSVLQITELENVIIDEIDNVATQKENIAIEEADKESEGANISAESENMESDAASQSISFEAETIGKGNVEMATSKDEQISIQLRAISEDIATIPQNIDADSVSQEITTEIKEMIRSEAFITSEGDDIIAEEDKLTKELENLIPLQEPTMLALQNVFEPKSIDEQRGTERGAQMTELEYALIDEPTEAIQNVQESSTIQYPSISMEQETITTTVQQEIEEKEKLQPLKPLDPMLEYGKMLNEEESSKEGQSSAEQFDNISSEQEATATERDDKTIEQETVEKEDLQGHKILDTTLEWETILKEEESSKQRPEENVATEKEDVTNVMESHSSTVQLEAEDILMEQENTTTECKNQKEEKCRTVEELDPILEWEGLLKEQEKSTQNENASTYKESIPNILEEKQKHDTFIEQEITTVEKGDEIENENSKVSKQKESSEKEEESIRAEQSDTSMEEEKIIEHDNDGENTMIQPEEGSDSDVEPAPKKPKHGNSSQTLLEVLECEDPENFPYDFPTHEKLSDGAANTSKNNGKSTDKPVFMHIDTERDQDKMTSASEQDEVAEDPIGESATDWTQDDTECIVPDTNQAQEERHCSLNGGNSDSAPSTTALENPEWEGKYVVNISNGEESRVCMLCSKEDIPKYTCTLNKNQTFICSELCLKQLKEQNVENIIVRDLRVKNFAPLPEANTRETENFRHCADCGLLLTDPDVYLSWECLEFCEMKCIQNYQKKIGSYCSMCEMEVMEIHLGKYCVRFGFDIRQFCSGTCLIKYKKGLKVCSYCRENVQHPTENTASDVKVKTRDFCSDACRESYMTLKEGKKVVGACAVCHKEKPVEIEFSDALKESSFCSEPCFVAFKYVNNVVPEKCGMCAKYYRKKELSLYMINASGVILRFCSKTCQNVYINIYRKIVSCCWCKVKKYNFDMIQRFEGTQCLMWCSLNCQRLYESSYTPTVGKRRCAVCYKHGNMIYHITSDMGLKSFCSYKCVRDHQTKQMPTLRVADISTVPTIIKRVTRKNIGAGRKQIIPDAPAPLPIITSVRSLAPTSERIHRTRSTSPEVEKPIKYVIMVRPADLPDIRNVQTTAKPLAVNAETLTKPAMVDQETQTDIFNPTDMEVVPVPIYIPQPIHMFNFTYIKAMPFAVPIPVPILIAMTKTGTSGILKEVKTAQPTPSDPYEADLLVMAQLVADANDKEIDEEQAVESEPDDTATDDPAYSPEPQEQNTSFGDDVLQMALHMATDFTEPAVDLEGALTANTITATSSNDQIEEMVPSRPERPSRGARKRGRSSRGGRGRGRTRPIVQPPIPTPEPAPEPPPEPAEKPDANMCLKYTFGVNAWKQWVTNKNNELEKSTRRVKLFKPDLLQLTSDELNYSLCLFIKEVRKPNGAEYAPDTIYYLCLGVQQYLFENGRIDNIFCDPYYETFTDSLDDICKKFSTLYNDSQYIVTRVEEEHLWESKQLGAHSPHVLLSTLMFFNTKHFNLTNVEEHMQLSFSHIMKHWKRVPNTPGTSKNTTSRNILLRFYPPQSSTDGSRKKKVYEQQENEENPIRCPVKLYEFYLSKCPESVKTRNDVFYLQPERSCVPDSPVWYSTMALGKESLEKMLHRVKMVKEINVALLSS